MVLPDSIAKGLPNLPYGNKVSKPESFQKRAVLSNGMDFSFESLVSCVPLPKLAAMTADLPSSLVRLSRKLKSISVYNINFGIRGRVPISYSWVYFPEKQFLFHRAGSVSACVPTTAPKGHASLYVEFSYRGKRPDPRVLGIHALQEFKKLGWLQSDKQVVTRVDFDIPEAYVLYDEWRDEAVERLLRFFEKNGVYSVGRYGRWEYGTMESAIEQGLQTARKIIRGTSKS